MSTGIMLGLYRDYIGLCRGCIGLYRDYIGVIIDLGGLGLILGIYWDSAKENGNYYIGIYSGRLLSDHAFNPHMSPGSRSAGR